VVHAASALAGAGGAHRGVGAELSVGDVATVGVAARLARAAAADLAAGARVAIAPVAPARLRLRGLADLARVVGGRCAVGVRGSTNGAARLAGSGKADVDLAAVGPELAAAAWVLAVLAE